MELEEARRDVESSEKDGLGEKFWNWRGANEKWKERNVRQEGSIIEWGNGGR